MKKKQKEEVKEVVPT